MADHVRAPARANRILRFAIVALWLAGCGSDPATDASSTGATTFDTATSDTATFDTTTSDTTTSDTAATSDADAAGTDAEPVDGGTAGQPDGAVWDGSNSDSNSDSVASDTSAVDATALGDAADGHASDASDDISAPIDALDQDTSGAVDAVPGPQPCSPALALAPAASKILPYDLHTFSAKGGTGAYRFALVANKSGAVLNKFSGAYLSGSKAGVTDTVTLTDLGCVGDATASVSVVEPMTMAPLEPWVNPKQTFTFSTTHGSGSFAYALLVNMTGATINQKSGMYTAGGKDGDDQVRATDKATGETSTAVVHVRKTATLAARPPRLVVPIGTTADVLVAGGSGHYTVSVPAGVFTATPANNTTPSRVTAKKAGVATAKIVDAFTGKVTFVHLFAVQATEVTMPPLGDGYQAAHVRRVPDLDGDGGDEVVVSLAEADGKDNNGGAVYVYRSKKGGLDLKPAQVLYGAGKEARFGWSMRVADVDGDKRADLIVGAPLADVGMTDNGAIYVYKGLKTGIFSKNPMAVLKGRYPSDQLGYGVAACDTNGDGVMDVIGGALYAEDRSKAPIVYSTGALTVWLGHADGFLEKPDVQRYGQLPTAGGKWQKKTNLRLGWDVASGDVDGDGVCDLAISSLYYKGAATNDGLVALFRGEKASATSIGGPAEFPSRIWTGELKGQPSSQFGRSIAMADVDSDGKSELIVGQLNWRGSPAKPSRGAVSIFDIQGLTSTPAKALLTVKDAAWQVEGPKSYDYYGYRVAVGDATGDGIADVLVQAAYGEVAKGPVNSGVVAVFAGRKGKMPVATPTTLVSGLASGDSFGIGMAAIGDLDGDNVPELVAFAGQDDTIGYNVGRPYYAPSKTGAKLQPMQMPAKASGNRFGWHTRFVGDLNGDGFADLAIGSPFDPANKAAPGDKAVYTGTRSGVTYIYRGTATGVDTTKPAWHAQGFPGHSAYDYFGWRLTHGGDFDGDGVRDLAVLARSDDRPGSFNGSYEKGTKCAGGARYNDAAVYVFRGQKSGWPAQKPAWVAWGPQTGQAADSVAMGMDINGDGKGDVVMGGLAWDGPGRTNAGGWGVYWGRDPAAAGMRVLCAPDVMVVGAKANDYLGRDVVGLHDIDGDGCDEFAVGADAEDHGLSAQGTVHIVFGWGDKCATKAPREFLLTGGSTNARAGISLDSGADIDGDKIPDLLVGGYNYSDGPVAVGTAWVVTSGYLKSLKPALLLDGKPPTKRYPIIPPGNKTRVSVAGEVPAGQFGWSVSFAPGLEKDGRAGILVGSPNGGQRSGALTGGAELFRWMKTGAMPGLAMFPLLGVAGESKHPGGRLGYSVAAGLPKAGKPVLVMSGYLATPVASEQIDQGAAYIFNVTQP